MSKTFCSACNGNIEEEAKRFCGDCGAERPRDGWVRDALVGEVTAQGQLLVKRRLGAGGFGTVYEVETTLGHLVRAMKVLGRRWMERGEVMKRFVDEAVILDSLSHPNVARCYAVGRLEEEGQPYILMEYIRGQNLTRAVTPQGEEAAPMSPRRAAAVGSQIAAALEAAHALNLLHRDLKPDNVLLTAGAGGEGVVKVIDFGIAKILDAHTGEARTVSIAGTPLYMAPEQYMPGTALGARLDLWQLGAVLYFILTGSPPYPVPPGGGPIAVFMQQRARAELPGPLPSALRESLKDWPALDDLVSRLLSTDPARRPASAREVRDALREIAGAGVSRELGHPHLERLCQSQGEEGWSALTRYVISCGAPERQRDAAQEADKRLGQWPDALRRASAASARALVFGQASPGWAMIRALDLSHVGLSEDEVVALASNPALARVRHLDLSFNGLGDGAVEALARSPHLSHLSILNLSFNRLGHRGVRALATSPHLGELEALDLSGNMPGAGGVEALACSARLVRLTVLTLDRCRLGEAEAMALASSARFAGLRRLVLDSNPIGDAGLVHLLGAARGSSLESLSVANARLSAAGIGALAAQGGGLLRSLRLSSNGLGEDAAWALAGAAHLGGLSELDLDGNRLGVEGAVALSTSRWLSRLTRLALSDNALGDAGVAAMATAPCLAGVERLELAGNALSAQGLRAVAASPALSRVQALDLSRNDLGDAGLGVLAAARRMPNLGCVDLSSCGLTSAGIGALLGASWRGSLVRLKVGRNALGAEGGRAVAALAELGRLEAVDLGAAGLGAGGAAAVAAAQSALVEVGLSSNQIGDLGARSLAESPQLKQLRALDLRSNEIGAEGAAALAGAVGLARLSSLSLSHNPLGLVGVRALAGSPGMARLSALEVEHCGLEAEGIEALRGSPHLAGLMALGVRYNAAPSQSAAALSRIQDDRLALIQESFTRLSGEGPALVATFYDELFARHPEARPLFVGADMDRLRQHLLHALVLVLKQLRTPEKLEAVLIDLGARHQRYGVMPAHFEAVVETLVDVIGEYSGASWSMDLQEAWREGLWALCATMLSGYR